MKPFVSGLMVDLMGVARPVIRAMLCHDPWTLSILAYLYLRYALIEHCAPSAPIRNSVFHLDDTDANEPLLRPARTQWPI
jgi:hypothetical protein